MWPQDVGVISLPERQALRRDGPNSRQLDNALDLFVAPERKKNSGEPSRKSDNPGRIHRRLQRNRARVSLVIMNVHRSKAAARWRCGSHRWLFRDVKNRDLS